MAAPFSGAGYSDSLPLYTDTNQFLVRFA